MGTTGRRTAGKGDSPWALAMRALRIAARRRCPACGEGKIWLSWFTLRERCPECAIPPDRGEPDYFLGAYLFNLIVAELAVAGVVIAALVALWPEPPWDAIMYGAAALAVIAPMVAYPYTTTLWLAVDMIFRPIGRER